MTDFNKTENCLECGNCFKRSPLFSLLTQEQLDLLNDTRVEVSFKRGEIIYKEGMPLTHLVIIHSGYAKIFINGSKGRRLILGYAKSFDLCGGIGIFIDQIHHSSLMATNDCTTCFIEVNAFKKVLGQNPEFMEAYLKKYSLRVQKTYHQFAVLTQKNMEGRMAEAILYLQEHVSLNGSIKNISKLDLADFTAMSRESAIRVLKEFKEDGCIEFNGDEIVIKDSDTLHNIAMHG